MIKTCIVMLPLLGVLFTGCSSGPSEPRSEALEFSGAAEIEEGVVDVLRLMLRATNASDDAVRIRWGMCPMDPILLQVHTPEQQAVWLSRDHVAATPCPAGLRSTTLGPGEREVFEASIPVREILGDTIAPGLYVVMVGGEFRVRPDSGAPDHPLIVEVFSTRLDLR